MAITVYSELQTAVANRMNRTDLGSAGNEGISACIGRLNRTLRHPQMVVVNTSFVCSARLTNLPSGFLQFETKPILKSAGLRYELDFLASPLGAHYDSGALPAGDPKYFSIRGPQLELLPAPSSAVLEIAYYTAVSQFSSANATDFILTSYPDVYLYGSLYHTAVLLMDDQRMSYYKPLFEESVKELGVAGKYSRYTPAMQIRLG